MQRMIGNHISVTTLLLFLFFLPQNGFARTGEASRSGGYNRGASGGGGARGTGGSGGKGENNVSAEEDVLEDMENDVFQLLGGMGHGGPTSYQSPESSNSSATANTAAVIVPVTINPVPLSVPAPIIDNSLQAIREVENARRQIEDFDLNSQERADLDAIVGKFRDNQVDAADVSKVMSGIVSRLEKSPESGSSLSPLPGAPSGERTLASANNFLPSAPASSSSPNAAKASATAYGSYPADNNVFVGGTNVQVTNEQTANPSIPVTVNNNIDVKNEPQSENDEPFGDLRAELDLSPKSPGSGPQVVDPAQFLKEYAPNLKRVMGRDFDSNLSQRIADLSAHKRSPASLSDGRKSRRGAKDDLGGYLDEASPQIAPLSSGGSGKAALPVLFFLTLTGLFSFLAHQYGKPLMQWAAQKRGRSLPSTSNESSDLSETREILRDRREEEYTDLTQMTSLPRTYKKR